MEFLHREKLPRSGFAGIKEYRLVRDPRAFDAAQSADTGSWPGLGNLVYLADACFVPNGETQLHEHREIDVISIMVEGRIRHEGSLQHGQILEADDVQVQRAGGEGFSHNEINPDDTANGMIQLWVLPETPGEPAACGQYRPARGQVTRVYGGEAGQQDSFASGTLIDVALLEAGQSLDIDVPFLAYLSRGEGFVNEDAIGEGHLIRGEQMTFDTTQDAQLIIVHQQR